MFHVSAKTWERAALQRGAVPWLPGEPSALSCHVNVALPSFLLACAVGIKCVPQHWPWCDIVNMGPGQMVCFFVIPPKCWYKILFQKFEVFYGLSLMHMVPKQVLYHPCYIIPIKLWVRFSRTRTLGSFAERNFIVLPVLSLSFVPLPEMQLASEANMGTLNWPGCASLNGCVSFSMALQ